MRHRRTGLCGVLAIDKPAALTSHDVVERVRRITGERRVGHAGTLDPAATGLMFLGVGAATRLCPYLSEHDKAYRARIVFGVATDTDDSEGRVLESDGPSEPLARRLAVLDSVDAHEVCSRLVGDQRQVPPAYCAIKKDGVTAYKAARAGETLELDARDVTVHEARFEGHGTIAETLPCAVGYRTFELVYWDVYLRVSKGTYIRSIARDMGSRLGCGAHVGALRRVSIAGFDVERARTLDELADAFEQNGELPWCDPAALLGFPVRELSEREADDVTHGRALGACCEQGHVSCVADGRLLAVYAGQTGQLRPATVIPGGVCGVA